jgi:hypothetical protein
MSILQQNSTQYHNDLFWSGVICQIIERNIVMPDYAQLVKEYDQAIDGEFWQRPQGVEVAYCVSSQ